LNHRAIKQTEECHFHIFKEIQAYE